MIRPVPVIVSLLILSLASAAPPLAAEGSGEAAGEGRAVLERLRDALLGDRTVRAIHYAASVRLETQHGQVTGTVREWRTADGKLRREIDFPFGSMLTVWDGTRGAQGEPIKTHEMPEGVQVEVRRVLSRDPLLLAASSGAGARVESGGTGTAAGRPCHVLDVSTPDGEFRLFVDSETWLPVKEEHRGVAGVAGPKPKIETFFEAWKTIDGVQVAHTLRTHTNGHLSEVMTLEAVEIDPELSPALFEPPNPIEHEED